MDVGRKIEEIAIGSILHDIGKILQRQGMPLPQNTENLFRHTHACYTNTFFDRLGSICNELDWANIANLASYHHNPSTPEQKIISEADIYSAAYERIKDDDKSELDTGSRRRPLVSIFPSIKINGNNGTNEFWAYPVSRWHAAKGVFIPEKLEKDSNAVTSSQYQNLVKDLMSEFTKLDKCPVNLLLDNILSICREYMSLVPSSTIADEIPDIPLFDHCYTTAAIACAMYQWHMQMENMKESEVVKRDTYKMVLFAGDVSGIQDFILDLPNQKQSGTAKKLRARSFYVSILSTAAYRIILERLNLPLCNCIMDAGGKFIVLAHNTPQTLKEISCIKKQFDDWMLKTFNGKLSLNISESVELSGNDLKNGNYRNCIKQLTLNSDKSKKRKFASILQDSGKWNASNMMMEVDPEDRAFNEQMKELGSKLAKAEYILLKKDASQCGALKLFDELSLCIEDQTPFLDGKVFAAMKLNPTEYVPGFSSIYLATHTPKLQEDITPLDDNEDAYYKGQIKPFNLIATDSDGAELLGVLKADVDRLGQLFSEGIEKSKYSISRLSAFSRQMNSFFSEYLQYFLVTEHKHIYTEYAGGDDLLLIGPWDKIIKLSRDINDVFHNFTCHNQNFTMSAAIVLSHPSRPIANAVREADSLLDMAKTNGRNRIGILGMTLEWDEFAKAIEDADYLIETTYNKKISQSLLYRLLRYYQMYERTQEDKCSITDLLWKSHLRYDLARNVKKEDKAVRDKIEAITMMNKMPRLKVSSTMALYKNRK